MNELNYKYLKIEVDIKRAVDDDIFHFLSKLDLSILEPLLLREYQNDFHFKFDPIPMTKAIILMKLKDMKSFEELYDYLKSNPDGSKLIGFNKKIPSRRTLSYFYNERISIDARRLIDKIAEMSKRVLEEKGIIYPEVEIPNDVSERTIRRKRRKYLDSMYKFMKENLIYLLPLKMNGNCIYTKDDLLDLLLHMAITNDFAENGSKTFKSLSGKTLLYHLRKLEVEEVIESFDRIIDWTYNIARRIIPEFFNIKLDVAIDVTDWLYYGEWDDYVIGTQPRRGTHKAYKYISVCVVESGVRFTLKVLPLKTMSERYKVFEELLRFALNKIKINRVYLDRGFYDLEYIRILKKLGLNFIIQAQKSIGIRKVIDENKDKKVIIVKDYEIVRKRKPVGREKVNLFIVPHRVNKDDVSCFVTNLDVDCESKALEYAELFRKRWGIETSFRVEGDFRPKTTSRNVSVRVFYFLFSVAMYNLWILLNLCVGLRFKGKIPEKPIITAKMFIKEMIKQRLVI